MNWPRSLGVFAFLTMLPLAVPLATSAAAQPYPGGPDYGGIVPPGQVMRTLTGMGLQPASEPRLRGHVWIVRGIGREGTVVQVMMDSHTGRVVDMRAVNRMPPYGPGPYQFDPRQPDPRYVMRDSYPGEARAYPAPRPGQVYQGQVYQDEPPYPGPRGAMPDDDDDDDQPMPQPHGYLPPPSMMPPAPPILSSRPAAKPENRRVAAKPPLPKARPSDVKPDLKTEAAKKDDGKKGDTKQDVAKSDASKPEPNKDEPKKEQASAPLTSPKDPETAASTAAGNQKTEDKAQAKDQAKTDAKSEANKTETK